MLWAKSEIVNNIHNKLRKRHTHQLLQLLLLVLEAVVFYLGYRASLVAHASLTVLVSVVALVSPAPLLHLDGQKVVKRMG